MNPLPKLVNIILPNLVISILPSSSLADLAIGMSAGFLALDESDVQKPYGKAFQWLDDVMDGSDPGKKIGKGYHVIGMASVRRHAAVLILPSGETDLATLLTRADPDLMTP